MTKQERLKAIKAILDFALSQYYHETAIVEIDNEEVIVSEKYCWRYLYIDSEITRVAETYHCTICAEYNEERGIYLRLIPRDYPSEKTNNNNEDNECRKV